MPASVTFSQSEGSTSTVCCGRLLAVEDLQRQGHAGAANRTRVGDGSALEALDRVELADEAGIVGADDRHQRGAGFDQRVDDHVVDARGPDAVERHAGGDVVEDLLLALVLLPAGEGLLGDLDVREFGKGLLEALVAIGVGRSAGGAAHIDDAALAAHLLEQPLGAEIGVLLLVVLEGVDGGLGDVLVDDDDDDAGLRWLP